MSDKTFQAEQNHLQEVYDTLQSTFELIDKSLKENAKTAREFKQDSGKRTALNFLLDVKGKCLCNSTYIYYLFIVER
ncbi:hypothetical protein [Companilactobacillus mishanensis]|uniref:hypothetical protein n=1 Tax=Companilactobacillus mishanensis TaxID=2486008 RepID=UPI0012973B80|nr:hypothetical protein [Companilactobacillus mishanensis]MQS90350.1 hypothetical protein [Companilactobacillus mishanensis]